MNSDEKRIQTFLGFAAKSRSIVLGQDAAVKSNKAKVILISNNLLLKTLEKVESLAKSKNIVCIKVEDEMFVNVFGEKNIKVVAVTDENLANAIKNVTNQN